MLRLSATFRGFVHHCLWGAWCVAELPLALVAISDLIPDWSPQHWNDHPARTQAIVIDTLARAQGRFAAPAHREEL
jgi:hypothetical protein